MISRKSPPPRYKDAAVRWRFLIGFLGDAKNDRLHYIRCRWDVERPQGADIGSFYIDLHNLQPELASADADPCLLVSWLRPFAVALCISYN